MNKKVKEYNEVWFFDVWFFLTIVICVIRTYELEWNPRVFAWKSGVSHQCLQYLHSRKPQRKRSIRRAREKIMGNI